MLTTSATTNEYGNVSVESGANPLKVTLSAINASS
ncbi:hypothetical protein EVA_16497 [gut metagenome]|uniref:Uncharacterized protein n=1 Tax=gut metagenome TaxID=749906 RepID=J9G0R2_9ZZZZ